MDLLYLSLDVADMPEVKQELDKVQEVVGIVMGSEMVVDVKVVESNARAIDVPATTKPKDGGKEQIALKVEGDIGPCVTGALDQRIKSLDTQLAQLVNSFSEKELVHASSKLVKNYFNKAFQITAMPQFGENLDLVDPVDDVDDVDICPVDSRIEGSSSSSHGNNDGSLSSVVNGCGDVDTSGVGFNLGTCASATPTLSKLLSAGREDVARRREEFGNLQWSGVESKGAKSESVHLTGTKLGYSTGKEQEVAEDIWGNIPALIDTDGPQTCFLCGKTLKHKDSLRKHIARHKKKRDRDQHLEFPRGAPDPQPCPLCHKVLKNPHGLQRHLVTHRKGGDRGQHDFDLSLLGNSRDDADGNADDNYNDDDDDNKKTVDDTSITDNSNKGQLKAEAEPEEAQVTCQQCYRIFRNKKTLKRHVKDIHRERQEQLCPLCGKIFKHKNTLRAHLQLHAEKDRNEIHKCTVCGKEYDVKRLFIRHLATHSDERKGVCHMCGKSFVNRQTLNSHIKSIHTTANQEACKVCGKVFSHRGNLRRHMLLHRGVRPYKCTLCDKSFVSLDSRREHIRTHSGNYPYQCSYCGKGVSTPGMLRIHERKHTGEKPYPCTLCGKGFSSSGAKKLHMKENVCGRPRKRNSKRDKIYICGICQTKFVYPVSLALHMLRHGEELRNCFLCNNELFQSDADLKSHIKDTHLKDRNFKCVECDETFYTTTLLMKHKINVHRQAPNTQQNPSTSPASLPKYRCEICAKEFSFKSNLNRHGLLHSGLKQHQCQVCEHWFSTMDGLKLHLWTHTTKKRFNCRLCDKGFNDRRIFVNHKQKFHPGEEEFFEQVKKEEEEVEAVPSNDWSVAIMDNSNFQLDPPNTQGSSLTVRETVSDADTGIAITVQGVVSTPQT